jgi:hypothetical protein
VLVTFGTACGLLVHATFAAVGLSALVMSSAQALTPVVRARARGSGRVSMAGIAYFKPGWRPRLVYAIRE